MENNIYRLYFFIFEFKVKKYIRNGYHYQKQNQHGGVKSHILAESNKLIHKDSFFVRVF